MIPADGADITCTITNTYQPVATAAKTVASTVENDNGSWTITYDLVVTNPDTVLAATYSLSDTPGFGTGMTITGADGHHAGRDRRSGLGRFGHRHPGHRPPAGRGCHRDLDHRADRDGRQHRAARRHGLQPAGHAGLRVLQLGHHHHLGGLGGHLGVLLTGLPDPGQVGGVRAAAPGQRGSRRQLGRHLHITVTNPSDTTAVVYSLDDTPLFDASVTVNSATVTDSSDGTNPITPLVNTWNGTTLSIVSDRHLPAFSIDTYTIVVNATAPAGITADAADCSEDGAGHGFYNLATATSGGRTLTADACTPVPHWVLSKSSDPASGSTVNPGDTITYTLTADNTSSATVTGATAVDTLPTNAALVTAGLDPSLDDSVAGTLTWTIPDIAPHTSVSVSYRSRSNAGAYNQTVGNVVTTSSPGGECLTVADCTTDHFTPHYVLSKSSDPASGSTVEPGDTITYTLTVHNDSNGDGVGCGGDR